MTKHQEFTVKYPLSHCPIEKVVRVGDSVAFSYPILRRRPEIEDTIKSQVCRPPEGASSVKSQHEFYCKMLGPRFNFRFQAAQYHVWIRPHMSQKTANLLREEKKHWRIYSDILVRRAHECLPYIQEAENDGLYHLIPTIVGLSDSPQNIKRQVGKGMWKRLAALSMTRARLMMQANVLREIPYDGMMDVASALLPYINHEEDSLLAARLSPLKNPMDHHRTWVTVRDTRRMLRGGFNESWSLARMGAEHDKATAERNKRKYSSANFESPWSFSKDGYTARLLISKREIAEEGSSQRHCLASYARIAAQGDYLAFRVDGGERLSIGMTYRKGGWRVDQCYGSCNSQPSNKGSDFANEVARAFNARTSEVAA